MAVLMPSEFAPRQESRPGRFAAMTPSLLTSFRRLGSRVSGALWLAAILLAGGATPLHAETRSFNMWWAPEAVTKGGHETDKLLMVIFWLTLAVFILTQTVYIVFPRQISLPQRRQGGLQPRQQQAGDYLDGDPGDDLHPVGGLERQSVAAIARTGPEGFAHHRPRARTSSVSTSATRGRTANWARTTRVGFRRATTISALIRRTMIRPDTTTIRARTRSPCQSTNRSISSCAPRT